MSYSICLFFQCNQLKKRKTIIHKKFLQTSPKILRFVVFAMCLSGVPGKSGPYRDALEYEVIYNGCQSFTCRAGLGRMFSHQEPAGYVSQRIGTAYVNGRSVPVYGEGRQTYVTRTYQALPDCRNCGLTQRCQHPLERLNVVQSQKGSMRTVTVQGAGCFGHRATFCKKPKLEGRLAEIWQQVEYPNSWRWSYLDNLWRAARQLDGDNPEDENFRLEVKGNNLMWW